MKKEIEKLVKYEAFKTAFDKEVMESTINLLQALKEKYPDIVENEDLRPVLEETFISIKFVRLYQKMIEYYRKEKHLNEFSFKWFVALNDTWRREVQELSEYIWEYLDYLPAEKRLEITFLINHNLDFDVVLKNTLNDLLNKFGGSKNGRNSKNHSN